jgi:excisionase family DNA binding protein
MALQKFLTTGQMAKMLSVTPDTVLKWIKQEKLPALRTAGGHYRVSPDALGALRSQEKFSPHRDFPAEKQLLYCWQFFAENGKTRRECQDCLIFHSQALKCFEMNLLPSGSGAKCGSCADSCESCAYYQYQSGRPFKVLVVTDDPACLEALTQQGTTSKIQFQFVSGEYESSRVVDWFRPDFVIVDCKMPQMKCQELCRHLANDPRIPNTIMILATPPGRRGISLPGSIRIRNPISLKEVENHLDQTRMGHSILEKEKEVPYGKQRNREGKL